MLAKISKGKSVFGVLQYNKIKVEDNTAEVVYSQKMFDSIDGKFSIRDCMDSFYPYLANNRRTENVVFHASLNPDPKDKLSDEQLSTLAQRYMQKLGYDNQPYIVFVHRDIQRTHAHIVSLRIDETGKKLNDSYEVARSMKICKELEQEFHLIPLKKGQRENEVPTKKIDHKAGDLKHQVSNITRSIMNNYKFQSFGEYRTLLEMFHVTVEEVKGEYNNKPYQGLVYSVTDDKGNKVSKPFKSSLFGKPVGYDALKKKFEQSDIKERLRSVITKAMRHASGMDDFKQSLFQSGIGCVFRQNEQGRIYGVSFIDYQNQTILNGSRLSKEFSANIFNGLFNTSPERNIERTAVSENTQSDVTHASHLSELSVRQDADTDSLGIGLFEQHGEDWENEHFAGEKEKEEKSRQRKKKYRGRGM